MKSMMVENGGVEPIFNVDKMTAFEVVSYSAIKHIDLQDTAEDFPKSFPKLFPKLIPSCFQERDKDVIETLLSALVEPKSAKELALIASCSVRTMKDKYLEKLLQAEVIEMTIPDKPTSRNQKYQLHFSE